MNYTHFKLISALIIFLIAIIAGAYPFLKRLSNNTKNEFPIGEALASGVFLGAGLLHMLSDSATAFDALGYSYPFPFLLAGITFLVLLWIEHLGREYYHHGKADSYIFAILATIMLSIHSFLAGSALGLSDNLSLIIVVLVAILAHKWAASFSLSVEINKSDLPLGSAIILFIIFATMAPLGVIFGNIITNNLQHISLLEPVFTALAAGTFLYLGTLHGLKRSVMVKQCCNLTQYTYVIIGFSLMAVLAIWA